MPGEIHDVVLVHDYLGQLGGAERVVEELCRVFPESPLYASYYAPEQTYDSFRSVEVHTSFLDHAPGIATHFRWYLIAYPLAFSSLRLPDCSVVLSSSSAFAKGVRVPQGAIHVCYCHSPMRFAWDLQSNAQFDRSLGSGGRVVLAPLMALLRTWDRTTSKQVNLFIANSGNVAKRIKRFYGRDALVVHPPVQLERFHASDDIGDFYLVVSRLAAYKRVDLAVEACTRSGRRLLVVGDGPDRARLQTMAGPSVSFLGRVDDRRIADLLSSCRALLFCGEEDFGITPLEAMASGRPVIALGRGGALETVVDQVTGLFFSDSTVEALETAISASESSEFDPQACIERANEFGPERFRKGILEAIATATRQRRGSRG